MRKNETLLALLVHVASAAIILAVVLAATVPAVRPYIAGAALVAALACCAGAVRCGRGAALTCGKGRKRHGAADG